MRKNFVIFVTLIALGFFSFAHEKQKFGLNFKTSSLNSIGFNYHVSDKIALRMSLGLGISSADSDCIYYYIEDYGTIERSRKVKINEYNVGLCLLYYLYKKNNFSFYTGLEFGYSRRKRKYSLLEESQISPEFSEYWYIEYPNSGYVELVDDSEYKTNVYSGHLIFGVQQKLAKHLWIFGELSFGYSEIKGNGTEFYCETDSNTWNLKRSGIGIIFYF